jgi:hypothetical protein
MLRADKNSGDRSSVKGYDVHWVFKGVIMAPSVKCLGVDSNVPGNRADIIIADDIESPKNSRTVVTRELLEDLTKEFESVCSNGDILYLGTPQSTESIYNNLPGRGYAIRIWTGRYPTFEQEENYAGSLAPMLIKDMKEDPSIRTGCGMDGLQGSPTCPEMFGEEILLTKEISQGPAKFQLQFMLNTKLADEDRYPLKLRNLIIAEFNTERGPVLPIHSKNAQNLYQSPSVNGKYKMYWAVPHEYEIRDFEETVMYIDPAGGGKNSGDEMAYAVIKVIGAYIYIHSIGGVPGGYEEENLLKLIKVAKTTGASKVLIEKNFGFGAHANMLKPLFQREQAPVSIEEVYETGQKELRVIDTLEPLLSSHRLVISPDVIEDDYRSVQAYPMELRATYRLLHQMAYLTREKSCLRHDDRIDALAGAVRYVVERLDFDTKVVIDARRRKEMVQAINTWKDKETRRTWLTGISTSTSVNKRNFFSSYNSNKPKMHKRNRF